VAPGDGVAPPPLPRGLLGGKTIVVTGGSMGLGRAAAGACLEAGANVFLCSRHRRDLDGALASMAAGGRAAAREADVSRPEQVGALLAAAQERYGRIDGLIHCAAVIGPIGPLADTDPEEWFEALRINLFGAMVVAREAIRRMRTTGGGRLVLFSGGGAGFAFPNYSSYACAKVAVVRLVETLAQEVGADGIEVNALAPGFVKTRMHDETLAAGERAGAAYLESTRRQLAEGGVPPEVGARAAAFLVSDAARGITGKFVAAPYDSVAEWPGHLDELRSTDIFTLRRIVPRDRGMAWQ
jgi:NAD(P)-dependent dehydrogenase (short-subunit alcohol dehydrogenase family)